MTILANESRTIADIQDEFNAAFPLLKIEFFLHPHRRGEASPKAEMLPSCTSLRSWKLTNGQGEVTIRPDMTVGELEQAFQRTFGLSAQVFRRMGNVWIETTVTDSWTLVRQNAEADMLRG